MWLAQTLTQSLHQMSHNVTENQGRHMVALQKLTSIFTEHVKDAHVSNEAIRQTLNTLTTPTAIHKAPHIHGQRTHNNKPGSIPPTSEGGQIEATEGGRENETTTLLP